MTRTKWLLYRGRVLEVRERRVMTSYQIWLYEDGRPIRLHSSVRLVDVTAALAVGVDLLSRTMADAVADVLQGRFAVDEPSSVAAAE